MANSTHGLDTNPATESASASRRKSQTDPSSAASENRKLRNRLSQKAHRARQSIYIKELEKRLECVSKPETVLNEELEERNTFFRNKLLDCQKKLESMQVTMKALSDSVTIALDKELSNGYLPQTVDPIMEVTEAPPSPPSSHEQASSPEIEISSAPFPFPLNDMDPNTTLDEYLINCQQDATVSHGLVQASAECNYLMSQSNPFEEDYTQQAPYQQLSIPQTLSISSSNPRVELPRVESVPEITFLTTQKSVIPEALSYHMDSNAYLDLSGKGSLLLNREDCKLRRTNSVFSDHIAVLEYFLQKKWDSSTLGNSKDSGLAGSVSFMVSIFVTNSWAKMTAFYAHTKSHHAIVKLTTWRLHPTSKSYRSLGTKYMPTHLQLFVPHPTIIDWVPFPSIRDKLIQYHCANPDLDELVCELGNSFVAEIDICLLIAGLDSTICYISVWDLIRAISPETTSKNEDLVWPSADAVDSNSHCELTLPAPSVTALFGNPHYALQAFRKLKLDMGAHFFKVDPQFFERHPEMHDTKADIVGRGVAIRPPTRSAIPVPTPLDDAVLGKYKECATWSYDLSSEGLIPGEIV